MSREVEWVTRELVKRGYALTDFHKLGLPFDTMLADSLANMVEIQQMSPAAAELTKHVDKRDMKIVQEKRALELGRQIVRPVVETLFVDDTQAIADWTLYGLNRYETDGTFGAHRDSVGSTVLVITATGVRDFEIYQNETDYDTFLEVEETFELVPGSIMVIDGQYDPAHAARCKQGPSVAAVVDIPGLLRP